MDNFQLLVRSAFNEKLRPELADSVSNDDIVKNHGGQIRGKHDYTDDEDRFATQKQVRYLIDRLLTARSQILHLEIHDAGDMRRESDKDVH